MNNNMNNSFYVVLPSNSSPLTQPNNSASNYIVDWQSTIKLTGRWEVALIEYNFPNFTTVNEIPVKIEYVNQEKSKAKYLFSITNEKFGVGTNALIQEGTISVKQLEDKRIEVKCQNTNFTVIFEHIKLAKLFGFEEKITESLHKNTITSEEPAKNSLNPKSRVLIKYTENIEKIETITFEKFVLFSSSLELCDYMETFCSQIFQKFKVDQNGLLYFILNKNIKSIKFDNTLMKKLGMNNNFSNEEDEINYGITKPELINLFNPYFIYTSITEPILVGGVNVPLLRSIWVETKYNLGYVVHETIENLIYVPVSSNSINNIEVQIRDDSGQFIKFPYGSKLSLTLHFRKIQGEEEMINKIEP